MTGGGGGGYTVTFRHNVTQGSSIGITVGTGWTTVLGNDAASGCSNFDGNHFWKGGDGGSGGGCGWTYCSYVGVCGCTNGGSDGSNGVPNGAYIFGESDPNLNVGTGQGSTTRAFGESWGTLYAGGGGGGGRGANFQSGAFGGSGGGGNGDSYGYYANTAFATDGAYGTGGGGGGGNKDSSGNRCIGGSGIAIIRWGY